MGTSSGKALRNARMASQEAMMDAESALSEAEMLAQAIVAGNTAQDVVFAMAVHWLGRHAEGVSDGND